MKGFLTDSINPGSALKHFCEAPRHTSTLSVSTGTPPSDETASRTDSTVFAEALQRGCNVVEYTCRRMDDADHEKFVKLTRERGIC